MAKKNQPKIIPLPAKQPPVQNDQPIIINLDADPQNADWTKRRPQK